MCHIGLSDGAMSRYGLRLEIYGTTSLQGFVLFNSLWHIDTLRRKPRNSILEFFTENQVMFLPIVKKRKNLEFQMLAAVYHKGDHGQYCHTLK